MRVKKLISQLRKMPDSAEVLFVYDSAVRGEVDCLWLSRRGQVVLSDAGTWIHNPKDMPKDAPEGDEWQTPGRDKGA